MHSRTRTWLFGAALTVLAVASVAALGAGSAAAASQHHAARIHKISACGFTASKAGTYELTKNLTDAGTGSCITLNGDNITLYLDSHTITGTGGDNCIYVEGMSNAESVNNTIVGGSVKTPSKPATLTGCETGVYVYFTSNPMVSHLKITSPTSYGVYADYDSGMMLSNVNVQLGSGKSATGIELAYGAMNSVTKCTVDNNGGDASFYDYYGIQDSFTHDVSADTYGSPGTGYGFQDYYSSRNNWSHDTSKGQAWGFYFYEDGYGPVTATYDAASYPKTTGSYGYYVYYADQEGDSASPFHTVLSHDKSNGFQYGYYDYTDTSYYPVAEKWTDNTADNYGEYGFYIYYPTDYTITGNVADGSTTTKKYDGSSTTYGFYLYYAYSYYAPKTFANNQAYDSEYGFYSDYYMIGGKGNVAKRNKYNAYDVQITG